MKKIIVALSMLFSINAMAIFPMVPLEDGDTMLSPMSGEVSISYMAPICPAGAICEVVSELNINYKLGGCLDRAATFHKVEYNNGVYDVYVSALHIANKGSLAAFCIAQPMHNQSIMLGRGFIGEESVNVHFIGVPQGGME